MTSLVPFFLLTHTESKLQHWRLWGMGVGIYQRRGSLVALCVGFCIGEVSKQSRCIDSYFGGSDRQPVYIDKSIVYMIIR